MANITEIRELARKLNLWNIARGHIDLNDEKLSNLDYLQMILQKELEIRARQKQIKLRKASKLPNKVFDASNLNKGLEWQIKQLSHLTWLNDVVSNTLWPLLSQIARPFSKGKMKPSLERLGASVSLYCFP